MGKILLVDDSRMMRRIVGQVLVAAGHSIAEAADGLLALTCLRETPDVSLVICDVNMPVMDGIQFLRALRSAPFESALPVVVLSTPGQLDRAEQARLLGAPYFLVKPFHAPQLLAIVDKLIGPVRPERQSSRPT